MTPLFSIITVTRNDLENLKKTRKSLKIQEFSDFEWVVIDGASNDGTQKYLHGCQSDLPAPVWLSEADRGLYDAMNKGIEKANGRYLLFLNAGDSLASSTTLRTVSSHLQKASPLPDFIYGDSYEESDGHFYYKKARKHGQLAFGLFTHHQAMLFARKKIGKLRYDLQYRIAADYDFTAHFLKKSDEVLKIPQPICIFISGGISQQSAISGRREQFQIRKNLSMTGPLINLYILMFQTAVWTLRRNSPALYWRLKSFGNKQADSRQSDSRNARPKNRA